MKERDFRKSKNYYLTLTIGGGLVLLIDFDFLLITLIVLEFEIVDYINSFRVSNAYYIVEKSSLWSINFS
jgi:hypothetical protein